MDFRKHVRRSLMIALLTGGFSASGISASAATEFGFELDATSQPPAGWMSSEDGLDAWEVQTGNAHSGAKAVVMTGDSSGFWGGGFNTLWHEHGFRDGTISVWFRAISGRGDQGGGIMWRVQDAENYYVARFNPLEDNFRIYTVSNGHRREFMSANIRLSAGWHQMTIEQNGNTITGYLDGQRLLNGQNDTFPNAGGVGVWTKADAATAFDDLQVTDAP